MTKCSIYNKRVHRAVLGVLLLLTAMPCCVAGNYIRINADFSYARDLMRKGEGAPFIENIALDDARSWVGSGKHESLKSSNGFAPAFGIGYRYTHRMLLVDVGLGVEYRYRINHPYDIEDVKADATDDTGMAYIGHHTWSDRETRFEHVGVTLPVMIGAEWNNIYFMAGVKAGVDIWGRSKEKGAYTLQGEYPYYGNAIFVNMPNHGFVDKVAYEEPSVPSSIAWNIRACAEVGYCISSLWTEKGFGRKARPRYYAGAFVEYGFAGANTNYRPLLAGIRLTALLPIPEPERCNCLDY